MKRVLTIVAAIIVCASPLEPARVLADSPAWESVPGPIGGSVAALAMSPDYANDHTVFAGLRGRGVYRTTDGGDTWQAVGLPDQVIVDLAISPDYAADRTIFAAARLAPAAFTIYRSTDGGATWHTPNITPYAYGFKPLLGLSLSPGFANDHTLYALNGAETYKSTDGGLTYFKAGGWFASHTITHLAISPAYASDHSLFAAVQEDQLYKSVDGGAHWNPAGLGGDVMALALSPGYPGDQTLAVVVRPVNTAGSVGRLRVSYDDGAAWNDNAPWSLDFPGQAHILFSPTFVQDRLMLAGSSGRAGLFRSSDGGQAWASIDQPYFERRSIFALALAPDTASDPAAFLGTTSGLQRSLDRGEHWSPANTGLPRLAIRDIEIAPQDPDRILAAASYFEQQRTAGAVPVESDGNLQLSLDGGQTWRDVSGRLDQVQRVAFSPDVAHDQIALACTGVTDQQGYRSGGILRSIDAGEHWEGVYNGYRCVTLALSPGFATDHTAWAYISAGPLDTGIFRSTDAGEHWTLLTNAILADVIVPSPDYAVDQTLFAATADGRVMKSTDGGAQWWPDMNQAVTALAISPAYGASQTLYAAAPQVGGLLRKTPDNSSWYAVNPNIPPTLNGQPVHFAVLDFAVDGSVMAGVTYGSSNAAVYRSVDGGQTWQTLGAGLDSFNLFDVASTANHVEGRLHGALTFYAATNSGLWRLDRVQRDPTEPGAWDSGGPRGGAADTLAVSPDFGHDGIALAGEVNWIRITDYGRGLFKSGDGGQSWRSVSPDRNEPTVMHSEAVHGYTFSPGFATDKTVFAATSRGLYKSTDGGDNWQWLKAATYNPPTSLSSVVVAPDYPASGDILAVGLYGCLALSPDYGQTWSKCVVPGSVYKIQYSPDYAGDHTIFADGFNAYRSTDRGLNWTQILTGTSSLNLSPQFGVDHTAFAVGAGVSRSIDSGLAWTTVLSAPVKSLAISPQFDLDQTLFGSGDTDSNIVYRSTNGGTAWLSFTIGLSTTTIGSVSLSPAFTTDHIAHAIGSDGLYRSTNGGDTWAAIPDLNQYRVLSLRYAPDWPVQPDVLAGTAEGLYRSTDGGETWSLISELAHVPIGPIVFSPDWPVQPIVLIGTAQGVYRSTDRGATWARMPGFEVLSASLVTTAANGAVWLTGTSNGLYATTDQGHSWQPYGIPRRYIYTIAASPAYAADHTVFVEGSYGGLGASLLRTTDGGATWQSVKSMNNSGDLAISPQYAIDHTIYAIDNGVWRSTDGGDHWDPIGTWPPFGPPYRHIALPPDYPVDATVFAAGPGFWRLPPGETEWQPAASGLLSTTSVSAIAVAPDYSTSHTVLAATLEFSGSTSSSMLLRSDDGGVNWEPSDAGLPEANLRSIAFSPDYAIDHTVYLVSAAQLYRSLDDGHSWTAIGAPPGWPDLNDVAVNPGGQVIVASSAGVWHYGTGFRDRLIDGDFEGKGGWELSGNAAPDAKTLIFSGQQALRLGLDRGGHAAIESAAVQTVTVPISATLAQFNLRLYPVSSDTSPTARDQSTTSGDAQYVTITPSGTDTISATLVWMLSNTQRWQPYSFDLTPYAGQTIGLRLGVSNDGQGGPTALYVDNASFITLGPAGRTVFLPVILKH